MSEWIDWVYTSEKPYPETLDTVVQVRSRFYGEETVSDNMAVGWWRDEFGVSNWDTRFETGADIVAYRVVS